MAWLLVGVRNIDVLPQYVSWYYRGVGYELWLEVEGFTFMDEGPVPDNGADRPDGDSSMVKGEKEDGFMDHGKCSDVTDTTGQTSEALSTPMAKESAPSLTPTMRLHFGSSGAASACSYLWGDRVMAGDPTE